VAVLPNIFIRLEDDEVIFASPSGAPQLYVGGTLTLSGSIEAFKKLRDVAAQIVDSRALSPVVELRPALVD
jgi:hypothetical protein